MAKKERRPQIYRGGKKFCRVVSICVINSEGATTHESKVFSEVADISQYIKSLNLEVKLVGFESGQLAPWLASGLKTEGHPAVCVEARHMHSALKAQNIKTDRNDARGIAHMMRMGWYKAVHIKSSESQHQRMLLGNRQCLLHKRQDIKNEVRGVLKAFGIKLGKVTAKAYAARVREVCSVEMMASLEPMLLVLETMDKQISVLDKQILDIVKNNKLCRKLMTMPGIGAINALAFKATIDDPTRFNKSQDIGAFLGLIPRKYASGEVDRNGRITKCGDSLMRSFLFEAAQVLLTRVKRKSALQSWGKRIVKRRGGKVACVAVARKMAVIMHRMWIDDSTFIAEFNQKKQEVKA